jgi:hypothetical protein
MERGNQRPDRPYYRLDENRLRRPPVAAAPPRPYQQNTPPSANQQAPRRLKPAPKRRNKFLISAGVTVIIAALGFGGYRFYEASLNPFPGSIKKSATTQLYYFKELPTGYTIDEKSFANDNGVVTFKLNGPTPLFIAEQKTPNYDINTFQTQFLKDSVSVPSKYGTAYIGRSEQSRVASLVTGSTWIFLSGPLSVQPDIYAKLIQSLQK